MNLLCYGNTAAKDDPKRPEEDEGKKKHLSTEQRYLENNPMPQSPLLYGISASVPNVHKSPLINSLPTFIFIFSSTRHLYRYVCESRLIKYNL